MYLIQICSYDFELVKHTENATDNKERDITLGYFPSLKHALVWLKREEIKSLEILTIDEYINESWKL